MQRANSLQKTLMLGKIEGKRRRGRQRRRRLDGITEPMHVNLRKLLRVPWTARRSNLKSILKEINTEDLLEELMLKLQYFSHLMQRANSLQKTLMLGKIEGRRRR